MELFEPYIHRSTGSTLLTLVYNDKKPSEARVLDRKFIDPSKHLCITRMVTLMDFKSSNKQDTVMIDQHYHTWSRNKRIFPILICSIFVVIAAVVIKVTILKKGKPQSKREKEMSRVMAVIE